jgi:activator of HSP90 ATPase
MAIGTSTTTALVTDSTLSSEVTVAGDIAAYSRATIASTTQNTGVVTYVAVFGTNNPQRANTSNTTAITEAGIFNSSTAALGGTMLCRTTFAAVNKGNDDTLQITWSITVS